jgi:CBS domain-containing protein
MLLLENRSNVEKERPMAQVREILAGKGSGVLTIHQDATVLQAAVQMNEHRVGALVVTSSEGIVGMFTERDVLRRVVGERRDPATTLLTEVMTRDVICCTPDTTVEEARGAMKNRRIRHLPVVGEANRLVGLVSIGDLNAYQTTSQEQTIYLMNEYIYGRV